MLFIDTPAQRMIRAKLNSFSTFNFQLLPLTFDLRPSIFDFQTSVLPFAFFREKSRFNNLSSGRNPIHIIKNIMKTIRATIDNGEILLQDPLPSTTGRFSALILIEDGSPAILQFPSTRLAKNDFHAEEEFEAIGLRDFFGDPVDERVNWENFFCKEL